MTNEQNKKELKRSTKRSGGTMNDSTITNTSIRLTKIDMDGQVYYSQFAFNLMLDKQNELQAENKKLREALEFYAGSNEINSVGKTRKAYSEDKFEFIFERARQALQGKEQ